MSDYQSADSYLLDQAISSDHSPTVSRSKSVAYVSDNNQGSYQSGVITIDAASALMGSKGFASLRDSYLTLPYVVTVANTGATALGASMNRFCTALKAGVWNVVDSLAVELDGKTIITENDYKMYWNNIRAQTEWSENDIAKHGADAFLYPDDVVSMGHSQVSGLSGDGFVNNFTNEQASSGVTPDATQLAKNDGFCKRAYCNPPPTSRVDGSGVNPYFWPTQRSAVATTIAQQSGRGAFVNTAAGAAAGTQGAPTVAGVWYHMLKIRLVDLHPIFKELDLMANPSLKLRFRVNAGYSDIAVVGGGPVNGQLTATMSLTSTTLNSGNTVPVMIASAASGNAMAGVLPLSGTTTLRLAFGPLQNAITPLSTAGPFFPFTTSRLMIPFYDIANPSSIISKPVKTIKFQDCYAQYFVKRAGEGISDSQQNVSFNLQLSAFQKGIKQVIVIPFSETSGDIVGRRHFLNTSAQGTEQFRSPFDSAPWTCQPGSAIRNFQVQVGSTNVFSKTLDYDYEVFNDEFRKVGAINGAQTHEISNGLIDLQKYANIHRYMVADCSRITDPNVPQSVQVSGINGSNQGCNLLVLVLFERSLSYDRLTGEVQLQD
jgi:hypothetical protein